MFPTFKTGDKIKVSYIDSQALWDMLEDQNPGLELDWNHPLLNGDLNNRIYEVTSIKEEDEGDSMFVYAKTVHSTYGEIKIIMIFFKDETEGTAKYELLEK